MAILEPFITDRFIRQGTSYARGTTIDAYLTPRDCARLYSKWNKSWEEQPYEFRGGEKAITCEMVLSIAYGDFIQAMGEATGKRIIEIAQRNAGR